MKIAARDLRVGDVITVGENEHEIQTAHYADGRDGDTPRMITAFPVHTKSAVAMKLTFKEVGPAFFHPAEAIEVLGRATVN